MSFEVSRVGERGVLALGALLGVVALAEPSLGQPSPPATLPAPAAAAEPPASLPPPAAAAATTAPAPPADTAPAAPAPSPAASSQSGQAPYVKPPPEPSTGFQMAFRTGLMFPIGDATGAPQDSLSARYAWQVPLNIDIGAKILPSVFLGAYLGFGLGAEGSDTLVEALCNDNDEDLENDVSCSANTLRLGLELQYHFRPAEKMDPWIGYGAGFESASESLSDREQGYDEDTTASGFTVAQISGGLDFRSKVVGVGPYMEVAIGRFTSSTTEVNNFKSKGDIDDPAWHAWLSVGLRMVLFP